MTPNSFSRKIRSTGITLALLATIGIAISTGVLPFALPLQAQANASAVAVSTFPPRLAPAILMDFAGGANLTYVCYADPNQPTYTWTVAGSTLTSIADSSNTSTITWPSAHGLAVGNKITIAGASDTNLNGTFIIQTIGASTTATITTASVADATYTTGVSITTNTPLTINPVWSILKNTYSGTTVIGVQWAQPGGSGNYTKICANRATSTGATKIEYR